MSSYTPWQERQEERRTFVSFLERHHRERVAEEHHR
jgi:hypothetical protein